MGERTSEREAYLKVPLPHHSSGAFLPMGNKTRKNDIQHETKQDKSVVISCSFCSERAIHRDAVVCIPPQKIQKDENIDRKFRAEWTPHFDVKSTPISVRDKM